MLNIHWNKIIIAGTLLLGSLHAVAQDAQIKVKNLPNYDARKMRYGFYLGGASTRFAVDYSSSYVNRDTLSYKVANPKSTIGFTLGFVFNRNLGNYFNLRLLPGVAFFAREVEFGTDKKAEIQEIGSTTVSLPVLIKYYSKRRMNSRMYFVAGVTPSYDVGGSKLEERVDNKLRADRNNLSVEYGVGVDLFYPFFKFAPELRVSHGLANVLIPDVNKYSNSFSAMRTNTVTLYLFFE